ncbi:MAG: HEAT repeat domain-containing protein, partial [Candidatus Heimdallarchaeota archaeon]|nr:HEAT repeat domain-containing protein [Candidatus Heimdallarchaeota archaeon]
IDAFGKIGSKEFTPLILRHLKEDSSEEVRVQAAAALQKCSDGSILDDILAVFQNEDSDEVKSHVTGIIANLGDINSVELLTTALENDDFKLTQAAAAEALHNIAQKLGYKDENEMLDSL